MDGVIFFLTLKLGDLNLTPQKQDNKIEESLILQPLTLHQYKVLR